MNFISNSSYIDVIHAIEAIRKFDPSESLSASTVLMLLYVMQYPDSTVKRLEDLTGLSRSASSRHVRILTERGDTARSRPGLGLVEFYEDPVDARMKRVKLTHKGKRLAAEIIKTR